MLDSNKAKADKILSDSLISWSGDRPNHNASWEELLILIQAGAVIKNSRDNEDGTWFYEVEYQGTIFVTSSQNKLK